MKMNKERDEQYIAECEILLEYVRGQLAYIADEYNADLQILTKTFIRYLKEDLNIKDE